MSPKASLKKGGRSKTSPRLDSPHAMTDEYEDNDYVEETRSAATLDSDWQLQEQQRQLREQQYQQQQRLQWLQQQNLSQQQNGIPRYEAETETALSLYMPAEVPEEPDDAEKQAAEKQAAEKQATEKATADKAAAEKALAEKAAAEKQAEPTKKESKVDVEMKLVTGRYRFSDQSHPTNYVYVTEKMLEKDDGDVIGQIFTALKLPYQPELMLKMNLAEDPLKWNVRVYNNPTLAEWIVSFTDRFLSRHRLKKESYIRQKVRDLVKENADLRGLIDKKEKAFVRAIDKSQRLNTQHTAAREVASKLHDLVDFLFQTVCGTLRGFEEHFKDEKHDCHHKRDTGLQAMKNFSSGVINSLRGLVSDGTGAGPSTNTGTAGGGNGGSDTKGANKSQAGGEESRGFGVNAALASLRLSQSSSTYQFALSAACANYSSTREIIAGLSSDLDDLLKRLDAGIMTKSDRDSNDLETQWCKFIFKSSPPDERFALRMRYIFRKAAEKGGLSVDGLFAKIDKDGDGNLTSAEFRGELGKLQGFEDVSADDINHLIDVLDRNSDGQVSLREFKDFLSPDSRSASIVEDKPMSERDIFIQHLQRIGESDGGVDMLLANMDEDKDGLISRGALMQRLKREDIFNPTLKENTVVEMLQAMSTKEGNISVVSLLRFIDDKEFKRALHESVRLDRVRLIKMSSHAPESGPSSSLAQFYSSRPQCEKLQFFENDLRDQLLQFLKASPRYKAEEDMDEEPRQDWNEYVHIKYGNEKQLQESVIDRHVRTKSIYRPKRTLECDVMLHKLTDPECKSCKNLCDPVKSIFVKGDGKIHRHATIRCTAQVKKKYLLLERFNDRNEKAQWEKLWFSEKDQKPEKDQKQKSQIDDNDGDDDDSYRVLPDCFKILDNFGKLDGSGKKQTETFVRNRETKEWEAEGPEGKSTTPFRRPQVTATVHTFRIKVCDCCTLKLSPLTPPRKQRVFKNWDIDYVHSLLKKAIKPYIEEKRRLMEAGASFLKSEYTTGSGANTPSKESKTADVDVSTSSKMKSPAVTTDASSSPSPGKKHLTARHSPYKNHLSDQEYSDSDSEDDEMHDESLFHYQSIVSDNVKRLLRGTVEACLQSKAALLLESTMIRNEPSDVIADWIAESRQNLPILCIGDASEYVFPVESPQTGENGQAVTGGAKELKTIDHLVENFKKCFHTVRPITSNDDFVYVAPRDDTEMVITAEDYRVKIDSATSEFYRLDDDDDDDENKAKWLPPPHATHLIMCDNPALLTQKIEEYIRCGMIIINGGPATTRRFCKAVDKGEPCFVFKYTGSTADLVGHMMDQIERESLPENGMSSEQSGPRSIPFHFLNDEHPDEYREALKESLDFVAPLTNLDVDSCRQLNVLARNWPDNFSKGNVMVIDFMDKPSVETLQDELTKTMSNNESMIKKEERKRLAYAWRLRHYFIFNRNAQKTNADALNLIAIVLSFITTAVAVIYTYMTTSNNAGSSTGLFGSYIVFSGFSSSLQEQRVYTALIALNICLPLLITVLKGAEKAFNPLQKYSALDQAALALESEIYRYRTKSGKYSTRRKSRNAALQLAKKTTYGKGSEGGGSGGGGGGKGGGGDKSTTGSGGGSSSKGGKNANPLANPTLDLEHADSPSAMFAKEIESIWRELTFSDISKGALVYPVLEHDVDVLKDINDRLRANRVVQDFLSEELPDDDDLELDKSELKKQRRRQQLRERNVMEEELGEKGRPGWRMLVDSTATRVANVTQDSYYQVSSWFRFYCRSLLICQENCVMSCRRTGRSCRRCCMPCRQCAKNCCDNHSGWRENKDDGISYLTSEAYVTKRLLPIIAEYTSRAPKLSNSTSFITFTTISLSVISSVLSTFGLVNWIPIALALASALGAYSSYQMIDLNLSHTNAAIQQLHTLIIYWDSLSLIQKRLPSNKDLLVSMTEACIQAASVSYAAKRNKTTSKEEAAESE